MSESELTDPGGRDGQFLDETIGSETVFKPNMSVQDTSTKKDSMKCQSIMMSSGHAEETESDSSESESTCTILRQNIQNDQPISQQQYRDTNQDQILSIQNLSVRDSDSSLEAVKSSENEDLNIRDTLVEIDLSQENPSSGDATQESEEGREMFSPYNHDHEQPQTVQRVQQFRGFNEASNQPAKISFASQRMKEYFESFKSHSGETVRLYQFFKSTRTELVACFLFSLIIFQALIVCRTHLQPDNQSSPVTSTWPSYAYTDQATSGMPQDGADSENREVCINSQQISGNRASVRLVNGLVTSFTVASLTQVFGHISGCHLLPSVSLALYVKGHISRARLASYLAAQSMGSFFGVSLLSLLTTSQITVQEYRELVQSRAIYTNCSRANLSSNTIARQRSRRKRREIDDFGTDINLDDSQSSEAILLSIIEQQQRDQLEKRTLQGKTITANVSTYGRTVQEPSLVSTTDIGTVSIMRPVSQQQQQHFKEPAEELRADGRREKLLQGGSKVRGLKENDKKEEEEEVMVRSVENLVDKSRALENATGIITATTSTTIVPHHETVMGPERRQFSLDGQIGNEQLDGVGGQGVNTTRRPKLRLKRRKRNRQQLNATNNNLYIGANYDNLIQDSKYYINMLEFTLPDPIMSSESIRQCIDKQQTIANNNRHYPQQQPPLSVPQLAGKSFTQCLSLSNSSQMFVFQLVATLLIVLTYLVNVDPRRIDPGFKSLSIGLSYFVASSLTIQSGGFYGNPFQLLFLSWFSPTSEWQTEWIIYLVTPFIGGLFGAISHEYIDFTSLRNRNKQLHLRRSFYSLDNLQENPRTTINCSGNGGNQATVEISTLSANCQRPARKMSSSSSLESAGDASSVFTFAGQDEQHHQLAGEDGSGGGINRKLVSSYSRQLRLERQRVLNSKANGSKHQAAAVAPPPPPTHNNCRSSLRRSDFDSNFLISSSSSPTAAYPRQISTSGFM